MINTLKYVDEFKEYIKEPLDFQYGMFCILKDDAPEQVLKAYYDYISLCSKVIQSWDETIIEDWKIQGFEKADSEKQQKQIDIAKKLIEDGIISNKIKH